MRSGLSRETSIKHEPIKNIIKMMKLTKTLWISLLGATFLSAGLVACSSSDDDNQSSDQDTTTGTLIAATDETDMSVDEMVALATSNNENTALPEDLTAEQAYKNDVLNAAQDLSNRYTGSNGTYHKNVSYKVVTLNYRSIDGKGNPITLSGKLTLPQVSGQYIMIEDIILHCHATNIDMTGNGVSPATFKEMGAYSFAVIDPDYIGFGVTSKMPQTYLCQKLIARQCVDMELAALQYMKQQGIKIKNGYGTYVLGYSQGGGNALAVGRHLQETDHGKTANKEINVKGLYCGAGPYSPIGTFEHWLKSDSLCLTAVLSMVIKGQQEGHADIMSGTRLTSYFSNDYLASGIPQAFDTNDLSNTSSLLLGDSKLTKIRYPEPTVKTAYEVCMGLPWMQFSKIMSPEFADPNSHIRTALLQCLQMERVDDWTPRMPVELYTAPRDNVIPVKANAYSTYEKFRAAGAPVTLAEAGSLANHITGQVAWANHVKILLKKL